MEKDGAVRALAVRFPSMHILRPNPVRPDPAALPEAVRDAIRLLDGRPPEVILVNDPQRATRSDAVLNLLWEHTDLSGARVVVAAGSHRFADRERRELERGLPRFAPDRVDWHEAGGPDLEPVGGWRAHPWVARAERILAIGSVEPHYFAGFSGAHKTATIGCAALADITRNHAGALEPACRPCRLTGTPVHEGIAAMLAALEAGRRVAAVNLMQMGATVVDAAGGLPLETLARLAPRVEAAYLRRIPRPARALVAEVAGPLACSFYQAEKGIKNSEWAVRDGGVIVLAAPCPQGIGQAAFTDLLREAPTHREALARVRGRGYRLGDHKAVRLRYLTDPACRNVRVFAVSPGLDAAAAAVLGLTLAPSVDAALAMAGIGTDDPDCHRIEDAANTVVEAADAGAA